MKRFSAHLMASSFTVVAALCMAGCGGDDTFDIIDGGDTEVQDINFEDAEIRVGEGTVAFFDFDYDNFDVQRGDDLFFTVRLPAGTSFREDSAEIDGSFDDDERVRPTVIRCGATGESYLYFTLDNSDLDNGQSDLSSDATLKLTINGNQSGTGLVAARASKNFELPDCDRSF